MRNVFIAAGLATLVSLLPLTAKADTFIWQDPKGDFTMSFPDTWRVQTPENANTYLRVAGPIAEEKPVCTMQVSHDGRALIYPKRLVDEAVVQYLNEEFFRDQIAQYANAQLTAYYAPASMGGKGDATAARFVYNDNGTPMYGVMFASLYGDHLYLSSCASKLDSYNRWSSIFASILGSVELKDKYHPFPIGYYRDFLADPELALPRVKPGTVNKNSYDIRTKSGYK